MATLISEPVEIQPGVPFTVGLLLRIEPAWHVYWKNPGDSGLPTSIEWDLPPGFSAGPIQWPVPDRLVTQGLVSYGYAGQVLLPVTITPSRGAPTGTTVRIGARARWLACRVECIPGTADLALSLAVSASGATGAGTGAALFASTRARLPLADGGILFSAEARGSKVLLVARGIDSVPLTALAFYPDVQGAFQESAPQTATAAGGTLQVSLTRSRDASPLPRLSGILLVDAPGERRRALLVDVPLTAPAVPPGSAVASFDGLLIALLLALGGGFLLNLMPCVLPVISLKVLSLVREAGGEARAARRNGLLFALGVLAAFWIVAAILVALRAGGTLLGWGFQLQNPVVVIVAATVFFLIGLNLFGVFEVGTALTRLGGARGRGGLGAFFSGCLATIVATPCTAPFMGIAVGYALSHSLAAAFGVFTALGLGMAAPYVVLSAFPGLLSRLPKPGAWMRTLRQVLGFPMMAAVIWMIFILSGLADSAAVIALLACLLLAGIGAWVWGTWGPVSRSAHARAIAGALGLALVIAGPTAAAGIVKSLPARAAPTASSQTAAGAWEPWSAKRVEELREAARPVLIDFTARWCLTCQVNERIALENGAVKKRIAAMDVATLRADWTDQDPDIAKALAGYGRASVPLYVLYFPGIPDPILLPELLTPGAVLGALDKAGRIPPS